MELQSTTAMQLPTVTTLEPTYTGVVSVWTSRSRESRRSFQTSRSRGNVGRSRCRSCLGMKVKCLGVINCFATIFTPAQNFWRRVGLLSKSSMSCTRFPLSVVPQLQLDFLFDLLLLRDALQAYCLLGLSSIFPKAGFSCFSYNQTCWNASTCRYQSILFVRVVVINQTFEIAVENNPSFGRK